MIKEYAKRLIICLNVFLISWLSDVFLKVLTFVPAPPNLADTWRRIRGKTIQNQ